MKHIDVYHPDNFITLAGNLDEHFNYIEKLYKVSLSIKGNQLQISGEKEEEAKDLMNHLLDHIRNNQKINKQLIAYFAESLKENPNAEFESIFEKVIGYADNGYSITPKTLNQLNYINLIEKKDLIFGLGPAGTGKTFLAVAMGLQALKKKSVKKIIITRPAIEAGESLGFLPGDMEMKLDPYLKPVIDAFEYILGQEQLSVYRSKGIIEIVPLAYMRGRTLNDAYIILDEAQNTTRSQMKMFLTRFGYGAKVVINGDVSQTDLNVDSGLSDALKVLNSLEEIGIIELKSEDVVRHGLVKKIISMYENH